MAQTAISDEKGEGEVVSNSFRKFHRGEIVFLVFTVVLVVVTVCASVLLVPVDADSTVSSKCFDTCKLTLVETIPENVSYPDGSPVHMDTFESWTTLIDRATFKIDVGSFYWTMRDSDTGNTEEPSSWKGEKIFEMFLDIGQTDGVSLRIVQNNNTQPEQMWDTELLAAKGAADVRTLDFDRLLGAGILHTKMMVSDEAHFYVGSANFDWRALSQIQELGIMVTDCPCMAKDLQKAFDVYWMLGAKDANVPVQWPKELDTDINLDNPMSLEYEGLNETMYISIAPPAFLPQGRTADLTAVLDIINKAEEFIYIALMDYFPITLYAQENIYWPEIDNRLRAAAFERGVRVRLMPSWWRYSYDAMKDYLRSLQAISPAVNDLIEVKLFEVPIVTPAQERIPYSRVNHNKYMVTETTAFIGTSNWSGDYFIDTAGVSVVVSQKNGSASSDQNIHVQLKAIFERNWNSTYAKTIDDAGT